MTGVDPLTAPVLYAFTQAREDLARYTEGLTAEQLWASGVGFHIRHISRSTDRLIGYLEGRLPEQLGEGEPGASREELLAELDSAFSAGRAGGALDRSGDVCATRAKWAGNACRRR